MQTDHDGQSYLGKLEKRVKSSFDNNQRILSFDEYLSLVFKDPHHHTRSSAQYVVDMMDHFGKKDSRYKLFDMEFEDPKYRVIGQNEVQEDLYLSLQNFVREGINNKLILLHGPNGSAKSSLINCISKGLEHYSETPEGAQYRINWIFPVDKISKGTSLGLSAYSGSKEHLNSYAKLLDDDIAAKVVCELKDHPLLLLPIEDRKNFFKELFAGKKTPHLSDYLTKGGLCHKSKMIFEALLTAYKGDLKKVLMHVQVERFFVSKQYRSAAVTIEPQMHVDAQARQITMDRSLQFLPPSLQSISLYELSGDLVDGNRGMIDFADLLKRPVDTFKYLLMACENGNINVGPSIAFLDTVWIGSTNELQLDAFKEFPDFTSFKARIELVRVPYLLEYSKEEKIYETTLDKISTTKHVSPHTSFVVALWAVLTRLKKPNAIHYTPSLTNIIGAITPIEKAKFYDHTELPLHLSAEEKKLLRGSMKKIRDEYSSVPYFEGRMGASPREIKNVLYDASQNTEYHCLGPLPVFKELEELVKRVSEYEFLKQDVKDGYHDNFEFIHLVKAEYISILDREIRSSMGLFESAQYEDFLKKYIIHVSHLLKKEKIKNSITGKMENPDNTLIEEFEKIIDAPTSQTELEGFRNNVITSIGAHSLDHPGKPVDYQDVFPEFMKKLDDHYFNQQKSLMRQIGTAMELFGTEKEDLTSDSHKLAKVTLGTMVSKFHYCEHCARQAVLFLVKSRY